MLSRNKPMQAQRRADVAGLSLNFTDFLPLPTMSEIVMDEPAEILLKLNLAGRSTIRRYGV